MQRTCLFLYGFVSCIIRQDSFHSTNKSHPDGGGYGSGNADTDMSWMVETPVTKFVAVAIQYRVCDQSMYS